MRKLRPFICLCLFFYGAASQAQNIQPGLWEITTHMQGGSSDKMAASMEKMQKEMANMPPDQRKMMQDMMAKQGVQMGSAAGGGISMKVCMTPEMAARNELNSGQRGDCKHTSTPRLDNRMKYSFVCTNPASSGEGEVTFRGREGYSTKMSITSTVKGKPEKMDIQGEGKWLGKDCGNIKPLAAPQK
jgi:hypothetical protein